MKERTSRLTDGFFARHEAFGAIKTEILGACGLLLDAFRQGGKLDGGPTGCITASVFLQRAG